VTKDLVCNAGVGGETCLDEKDVATSLECEAIRCTVDPVVASGLLSTCSGITGDVAYGKVCSFSCANGASAANYSVSCAVQGASLSSTSPPTQETCLSSAVGLFGSKVTASRSGLVVISDNDAPSGCSVLSGGAGDWAAHWNTLDYIANPAAGTQMYTAVSGGVLCTSSVVAVPGDPAGGGGIAAIVPPPARNTTKNVTKGEDPDIPTAVGPALSVATATVLAVVAAPAVISAVSAAGSVAASSASQVVAQGAGASLFSLILNQAQSITMQNQLSNSQSESFTEFSSAFSLFNMQGGPDVTPMLQGGPEGEGGVFSFCFWFGGDGATDCGAQSEAGAVGGGGGRRERVLADTAVAKGGTGGKTENTEGGKKSGKGNNVVGKSVSRGLMKFCKFLKISPTSLFPGTMVSQTLPMLCQ
jgi:hypothetical protein